jgi:hypothetical protein
MPSSPPGRLPVLADWFGFNETAAIWARASDRDEKKADQIGAEIIFILHAKTNVLLLEI